MDVETELLANSFSYILGAVSFIGFIIVASDQIRLWFGRLLGKRRVAGTVSAGSGYGAAAYNGQNLKSINRSAEKASIILGLIFMGVIVSAAIFILHTKVEQFELKINLNDFLLLLFAFTMLPGGLAGIAAGAWINANNRLAQDHLLEGLLAGTLVYLAFITLFEFTEVHLLLFACGPAITLIVYRFAPKNT